jgi:hypothetical protein
MQKLSRNKASASPLQIERDRWEMTQIYSKTASARKPSGFRMSREDQPR